MCVCSGGPAMEAFVPFDQDSINQHHSGNLHRLGHLHRYGLCECLTCIQIHHAQHSSGLIKENWELGLSVDFPYKKCQILKNQ